jgi:hypothetical protein
MTIIHDFKSLRDHMDKLIQRDIAREQTTVTMQPPQTAKRLWCPSCAYKGTCPHCQSMTKPSA